VLLIDPEVVKLQPMFVTTTIAVIYFTVFIQGITIKPLVKILNVKTAEKRKPTMNERIHERVKTNNRNINLGVAIFLTKKIMQNNIMTVLIGCYFSVYGPFNGRCRGYFR
jgi:hypothetical protein